MDYLTTRFIEWIKDETIPLKKRRETFKGYCDIEKEFLITRTLKEFDETIKEEVVRLGVPQDIIGD